MKRFWHNNSLSIVLFGIFFAALAGMSIAGWYTANSENVSHHQPTESYVEYLGSGDFIEGVFENWESEFLQMWALVVLTIWLRQKGADDSKPIRGQLPQDTKPRYRLTRAKNLDEFFRALGHTIYAHSLGIVLLLFFFGSVIGHDIGGTIAYDEQAKQHGQPTVSPVGYLGTSQFWYESLQNWQSEFFSVGMLMVLSIKLRERGSPESKPVGKRFDTLTG